MIDRHVKFASIGGGLIGNGAATTALRDSSKDYGAGTDWSMLMEGTCFLSL
jgi:hypothetical protein